MEGDVPLTLIGEAVFARFLSALKEERTAASQILQGPRPNFSGNEKAFLKDIEQALYASKIVSYAQGYALLGMAAATYNWDLDFGALALIWRGGCIISSAFLAKINKAFAQNGSLANLLLDPFFKDKVAAAQDSWRRVCAAA